MRINPGALHEYVGAVVRTSGWLHAVRDQKSMQFLVLGDRSGSVQLAIHKASLPEVAEIVSGLHPGATIEVTGQVLDAPRVKLGGIEIAVQTLRVLSHAAPSPIGEGASADLRLEYRHVDMRRLEQQLIARVSTTLQAAMREHFINEGCIEIQTPKLMAAASESGASVFEVAYFDRTAYLAQSPQFSKQLSILGGMDKIFEFGPVFRAEASFSARHLTEFVSVDAEMAWIDSEEDVMAFEERWLVHALTAVKQAHGEEIERVFGRPVIVPSLPFPRISFADALERLAAEGFVLTNDLNDEAERALGRIIETEHGHEWVFVTDWPSSARPFYHMRTGERTHSFDLVWRGLEVTTGAQREHRHEILVKQAQAAGLGESVAPYLASFEHGAPPHGGFGFGLARLMMLLCNQESVRDVVFAPRTPNRLTP